MKNRRKPSFTMNRTQLKLIAVALMTLNHIAAIFLNPETFLHAFLTGIGYFTAAVMCFFLAEGFLCTTSRRRYGFRLLLFALLSEYPYLLAFSRPKYPDASAFNPLNMLFTLFFCFLMLQLLSSEFPRSLQLALILPLALLTERCDWGILAPVFVLLFYHALRATQSGSALRIAWLLCCALICLDTLLGSLMDAAPAALTALRTVTALSGPLLAAICILLLYQRSGRTANVSASDSVFPTPSRLFFYLYYPLHLLLLAILHMRGLTV